MSAHTLAPTTRTVEQAQIAELNGALTSSRPVTARDVGLDAARVLVPLDARVASVVASGPPTFPYLHAMLVAGDGRRQLVELHTRQLRLLSRSLGLHQNWGCGVQGRETDRGGQAGVR